MIRVVIVICPNTSSKMCKSHELPDCIYEPNQPILIRPKTSTPNKTLYLSNLDDQNFLRFSIKYLYVFRKCVNIETLKESLSRVLVEYYPLAGRLRKCVDDDDGKLEIDCNGEGAVFAEAKMDFSAEEFLEFFAAKPNRSLRKFMYRVEAPGFLDIPPLVIQVTNLRCGGMILCTVISHCLCDGIGTSQFLHAWAHTCQSSDSSNLPYSPPPFHDRHVLKPRSPPQVTFTHTGFTNTTHTESNPQTSPNIFKYLQSQPLVPASITFSPSQIHHLKSQCMLKCTAFEALASHTWRCWVKSLELPFSVPVKLLFSISVRTKMSHIPEGYFGNTFVMGCAEAEAKELVTPNLRDGVKLVQRAKSMITNEYVQSMIDLLEDKEVKADLSTTLVISQWAKLGLEDLDFGEGKPIHMGPVTSDIYCLFLPVAGEVDAVKVLVSMPESVIGKFEFCMMEFCGVAENGDAKNQYEVDNFKMVSV